MCLSFKFDEDGNGTIEFAEFLVMMATKAKEAEIEEAENFIPCCFRVMRDKKGKTLKVHFYGSQAQMRGKTGKINKNVIFFASSTTHLALGNQKDICMYVCLLY